MRPTGSLRALLELVSPGLLDVFQYLAVKLLLGILHLEYLGGWKDLFELLKVLFFKFSNTDVGIRPGIDCLEALLLGHLGTAILTHSHPDFAVYLALFLL